MNILKSILNFFSFKKKKVKVIYRGEMNVGKMNEVIKKILPKEVEEKSGLGIIEMVEADKIVSIDGVLTNDIEPPTAAPIETSSRQKSLKDLAARKPKRKTVLPYVPPVSKSTSVFATPEFDTTPNPLKYWRRFKRGNKFYWKKFYHEEIILP